MGNQSCTPYTTSSGTIKVVREDGSVEEHRRPIRAGELMEENPGRFVCDSLNLQVGHRVPGLAAAEKLERHRCYFLLPMDILYSVLTEEEMEELSGKALGSVRRVSTKRRRRRIGRRSDNRVVVENPPMRVEDEEVVWTEVPATWKPGLDTINENPCLL